MCMQCAMGAMTAGAAATGLRSWLALRSPAWLTPARMRAMSAATLAAGVLAAGVAL
jgi:hypothetical protein